MMLRLTMAGMHFGTRRMLVHALNGMMVAGTLLAGAATATAENKKFGPNAPVTYDNRYEIYGGINFMNFQAGQDLPKRINLGGGEGLGTYYVTRNLGLGVDYRWDAGTTPVVANPFVRNRPLVVMNTIMGGAQYRGPKNHYAAINYHGYVGVSHGNFTSSTKGVLAQFGQGAVNETGLYTNRTKPIAALGASIDFNRSKNIAVRLQPDLILEHFGTETREFFSISGGIVYRFGQR
jgi:hypothetical protein